MHTREILMPRASAGVRSARYRKYGPRAKTLFKQMNMPEKLRHTLSFLETITTREALAAIITIVYATITPEFALIMRAHDTAQQEMFHIRRHSGERAFRHAFRCVLMLWLYLGVRDPDCIAAMFLHDLPETFRRKWTRERLTREFNARVAEFVMGLTKPVQVDGLSKHGVEKKYFLEQIPRILAEVRAHVAEMKAVDVLDNLLTLWKRSVKRLGRKIDDVIRYVLPLLHAHGLDDIRKAIILVLWEIRRKLRNGIAFAH